MALLVNQLQHARVLATRDITAQLDPLHQLRFVSITRRLLLVVQGTALGAGRWALHWHRALTTLMVVSDTTELVFGGKLLPCRKR